MNRSGDDGGGVVLQCKAGWNRSGVYKLRGAPVSIKLLGDVLGDSTRLPFASGMENQDRLHAESALKDREHAGGLLQGVISLE